MQENASKKVRGRPFPKGRSGNPHGGPKAEINVIALARERGMEAFEKLLALLHCGKPEIELRAAEAILDRAYGKPRQSDNDETRTPQVVIHTSLGLAGDGPYITRIGAPTQKLLPPSYRGDDPDEA